MKYFLFLLPLLLNASVIKVGDTLISKTLESQYERKHQLVENGLWIISYNKDSSNTVNEYFTKHRFKKDISFIVDAAQIPSILFTLFAKPKMKKYKYPILLSFDENYNLTLPKKEGFITILTIQNSMLKKIEYVKTLSILHTP